MATLVSDIMETDIISINFDDTLKDAANVFENIKIRHIPVVSGETLLGIVSKSDVSRMKQFCQLLESGNQALLDELENKRVKSLMRKPITINANDTVEKAIELFTQNHFHALPVMNDGSMVGIVTSTDILRHFATD